MIVRKTISIIWGNQVVNKLEEKKDIKTLNFNYEKEDIQVINQAIDVIYDGINAEFYTYSFQR